MSEQVDMSDSSASSGGLVKSINWKQGVIIAMGVPILIVPSIADLSVTLWALSIVVWVVSVLSGFFLNLTLGEMCATFGVAGIGGSIQYVFRNDEKYKNKKLNVGRMIGSFGAWNYFVCWVPVIPIFTIMCGEYILTIFEFEMSTLVKTAYYLAIGIVMYAAIILMGRNGLEGGARVQMILTIITIVPILVIALAPVILGHFDLGLVTGEFTPTNWAWDGNGILIVLGTLVVAQWSAVAWESAATYGSEYKDPATDVPKALIACGLICLAMYFLISFCVYGVLGQAEIEANGATCLQAVAELAFGQYGGIIAVVLLIVGMVMIVQTAFLGAARTIQVMATDGNLPLVFSKTNKAGVPMNAMFFETGIGVFVIVAQVTSSQILAISATGFSIALGLASLSFIIARRSPRFKDVPRAYKVPKALYYCAYAMVVWEWFMLFPGIMYYLAVIDGFGISYVFIGIGVCFGYIPAWCVLQWWNHKHHPEVVCGINFDSSKDAEPTAAE